MALVKYCRCTRDGGGGGAASVRVLSADSLNAVNTPAMPELVSIVDGTALPIANSSVEFLAPKFSVSVITVGTECVQTGDAPLI